MKANPGYEHFDLAEAIYAVAAAVNERCGCHGSHDAPATKQDLLELEKRIMSQITDITAGIQKNLDEITKDIAAITAAGVGGIPASDIAALTTVATNVATATTALDALVATIPPATPVTPAV
jgi:hypothetical protein